MDEQAVYRHPVEIQRALHEMATYLKFSEGSVLLIAASPDPEADRALAGALGDHLRDQAVCLDSTFSPERLSLAQTLRDQPVFPGKTVVMAFGLDELPPEGRRQAISNLNIGREGIRYRGLSLILWVRPGSLHDLMLTAPDFFSVRSSVYEFGLPADPALRAENLAALRLSDAAPPDELRGRYLSYMVASFRWLGVRGLLQVRNIVRLLLDQVYVPLWATREERGLVFPIEFPLAFEETDERPEHQPMETTRQTTRVQVAEILGRERRVVVLGDPGSGKSTLLKQLALTFARALQQYVGQQTSFGPPRLPILLSIAAYAQVRRQATETGQPPPTLADYLPRHFAARGMGGMGPLFQEELAAGGAILLLDGLDEVLSAAERAEIVRQVGTLTRVYPAVPVVVTSRIAGYSAAPLPAAYVPLTLEPFGPEQVSAFARGWSLAYEASGYADPHPDRLPPQARLRAEARARNLTEAVRGDPGVSRLATNPLLLTILALIHQQGTRLPQRRVDLYRLCVEALAETWNLARTLTGRPINLYLGQRRLDADLVSRILAPVAFWMHQNHPGGLVARPALQAQITAWFREQEGRGAEQATTLARDFVDLIREQSGLLVERGLEQYGFMHLTFEEYLAARYIAPRRDSFVLLRPHLHDSRWHEVILLTAALLGYWDIKQAGEFVRAIHQAGSLYENVLHRDLLLASRVLVDDVPLPPDLRRSLLDELLVLWRKAKYVKLQEEATTVLVALRRSTLWGEVEAAFLAAVDDENTNLRRRAVEGIGKTAAVALSADDAQLHPSTLPKLLSALNDGDSRMRRAAASTLGALGCRELGVLDALLSALSDENSTVRTAAARVLGVLGRGEPHVLHALLSALGDESPSVRHAVAGALGEMGRGEPVVLSALLSTLNDGSYLVRVTAAEALGALGREEPVVLNALLSALNDEESSVRWAVAGALGELGNGEPVVLNALLSVLNDEELAVQSAAAEALGMLGRGEPDVLDALLSTMDDEDSKRRQTAIEALGALGRGEPDVLNALLATLSDEEIWVQVAAAGALKELGCGESDVLNALLSALSDEGLMMRRASAEALGSLGCGERTVLDALLSALSDEDARVRGVTAWALGELGQSEPDVLAALHIALDEERNQTNINVGGRVQSVWDFAFEALWKLADKVSTDQLHC
ncbi:MAG: HEAT repeat domain-containing protein [Anaerolineae bacterium]